MIKDFIKNFDYEEDVNLKKYNTYKVESFAKYVILPKNVQELKQILTFLKENQEEYLLLGNGSNVILTRDTYNIVIKLDHLQNIEIKDNIIKVEAGFPLMKLAKLALDNNLSGLEFAGGIPGQVGASIAMNAGAYKEDIGSLVKEVKVLDDNLNIITLTNEDLNFSYRNSLFKEKRVYICLEATLELKRGISIEISRIMENRKTRRIETQPLDYPSAGSVFRNPDNLYAGALIEDLGLKGYSLGDAKVSEKHANFIINNGSASGSDIVRLINLITSEVKEKYDVDLILEQEIK